ncbi:DNA polymerase lambda [Colletotrichum chlorophyti]|uniref:DNA polymerase lambda n=1 Tax=Colletotrichum chlorophyti TaxID=708187 RepID=A0A1Q8S3G2_9PEZI|nr:DNA polymerase lambda [Colletotrichum chlorophyti]
MANTDTSFKDKARFFRRLELLGRQDDDDDEFQENEHLQRQQMKAFQAAANPRRPLQERTRPELQETPQLLGLSLRRTSTGSVSPFPLTELKRREVIERTPLAEIKGSRGTEAPAADTSFVEDTPIPDSSSRPPLQPLIALTRSVTTPLPATRNLLSHRLENSPSIAAMKKRKRDPPIKIVPADQQIFRGLRFYFIPNDDIAPARKIRIRKAQEYGAIWTRSLQDATHVVVDRNLVWQNIESVLRSTDSPSSPTVINEEYPLDCVRFRTLLNAQQNQYRVPGCPVPASATTKPQNTKPPALTLQDLPLKMRQTQNDPKKWDYISPYTPLKSPESPRCEDENDLPTDSPSVLRDTIAIVHPSDAQESSSQPDCDSNGDGSLSISGPTSMLKDQLEHIISQVQQFRDLPLDHDEDEDPIPANGPADQDSKDEESSGDERKSRRRKVATNIGARKDMRWEDKFACHKGGTKEGDPENPNNRTIQILQQMCDYYSRINDPWRPIAYRKAITQLKRQPAKICTADEAICLPGVGQRLADKIEEIVTTDRLKRLESAEQEPMDRVLQSFLKIYGVGSVQASQWIAQGFRTLDDLKENAKLTANQRIGIDHYDDLNTRIPRKEVKKLGDYVKVEVAKLDPSVRIIIGGSYRRGAEDSGDIDFIITKEGTKSTSDLAPFLHRMVQVLEDQRFLVARLAGPRDETDGSKWHGCCALPKGDDEHNQQAWRRVDFLVVPEAEIGAALIYFTGNDIFNRSIRLLASKKGMRLNQRGLYKNVIRGPGRVKMTGGELVEGKDERKIFEILGVKWREPHERWC